LIQYIRQLEINLRLFTVLCKLCGTFSPVGSPRYKLLQFYHRLQGNELCAAVLLEHLGPSAVEAKDGIGQTAVHGESCLINKLDTATET
jgi:hypothetical protein